ncbi:MAG: hypothetical protein J6J36_02520 [Clostridia bacterium]|nr:hypothetical protein [Clostridia bacterium]
MSDIKFRDFDIMGIIRLQPDEVHGIEKYVSPVKKNGKIEYYLSRSAEYYNVKSMVQLMADREELKGQLKCGKEYTKRNFVIIENMLNCSAKAYFAKFETYINSGKKDENAYQGMEAAKRCLMNDVKNIINLFKKQGEIDNYESHHKEKTMVEGLTNTLPGGDEYSARRSIEMDNKALLYLFLKSLDLNRNTDNLEVLTPGYGSLYIGPFIQEMYGFTFTNMYKSKYIAGMDPHIQELSMVDLMSSDRPLKTENTVLLLDDNVGTGTTMKEICEKIESAGVQRVITGAIQFNWKNYYRVSAGLKTDIPRFEVDDYTFISPFNYPGHKIIEYAVDSINKSGNNYEQFLQNMAYNRDAYPDMEGAIFRAFLWANRSNMMLSTKINKGFIQEDISDDEILKYVFDSDDMNEYKRNPAMYNQLRTLTTKITNPRTQEILDRILDEVIYMDEERYEDVSAQGCGESQQTHEEK